MPLLAKLARRRLHPGSELAVLLRVTSAMLKKENNGHSSWHWSWVTLHQMRILEMDGQVQRSNLLLMWSVCRPRKSYMHLWCTSVRSWTTATRQQKQLGLLSSIILSSEFDFNLLNLLISLTRFLSAPTHVKVTFGERMRRVGFGRGIQYLILLTQHFTSLWRRSINDRATLVTAFRCYPKTYRRCMPTLTKLSVNARSPSHSASSGRHLLAYLSPCGHGKWSFNNLQQFNYFWRQLFS